MHIHFISIGGAVMHNLAIALKKNGHRITGSDDEIYDPARTRLKNEGLLPTSDGWFDSNIRADIDLIILGMHAKADNPELKKAIDLKIPIYSFPEYIYNHSKQKTRVVVGGSHGKTTTTSMIMHALKSGEKDFDYLVGAYLDGFENMVSLSNAPLLVAEGDEYLSSAIDRRPKFFHYRPQLAILTGIAWDHMNVFPTEKNYFEQFKGFMESLDNGSKVYWYSEDPQLEKLSNMFSDKIEMIPYTNQDYLIEKDQWYLLDSLNQKYPVELFGAHNMANFLAARLVCRDLGMGEQEFLLHMQSFKGAKKRLQLIAKKGSQYFYQDFAHAPSKVRATTKAFRQKYPQAPICAVVELHTYSSLNQEFLPQYRGALDDADVAIVFFSPHTLKMKRMPSLNPDIIRKHFGRNDVLVVNSAEELKSELLKNRKLEMQYLMMSSGTFGGTKLEELADQLFN